MGPLQPAGESDCEADEYMVPLSHRVRRRWEPLQAELEQLCREVLDLVDEWKHAHKHMEKVRARSVAQLHCICLTAATALAATLQLLHNSSASPCS
jgi:endonuclease III-like uncharacterized protein